MLIEGYALFVHGYHRATTDIGLLVPATGASGTRIKAALMVLPDQAAKGLKPEWFTEGGSIRVADAFLVGVMLNACGETYDMPRQFAVTVDLEGIPVRTASLEGLLRTRRTVRDKDLADRNILEQAIALLKGVSGK